MRFFNNHTPAAADTEVPAFTGLGFDTTSVRTAAEAMAPQYCSCDSTEPGMHGTEAVWQPSGYELLVTLGREIRGR